MIQAKIADMAVRIESARLLNYKAAALKDIGMFCFRFFHHVFDFHVFAEKSRIFLHISQQILRTNPEFRKQSLPFFMNHNSRNINALLERQNKSTKYMVFCYQNCSDLL